MKQELQNKSVYSGQVIFLLYVFMIVRPSATQKWYNVALSWQKVAHPCTNEIIERERELFFVEMAIVIASEGTDDASPSIISN